MSCFGDWFVFLSATSHSLPESSIEELTTSIIRNKQLASTLYDVTFRKVLSLKAKIWQGPIPHTDLPWSDNFPGSGSEIHTDLHRLFLSLSLKGKKNSHSLWGSIDKVCYNSVIDEWWVPDMAVCVHDNEAVLFSQLNNLLQLDNVTVQYCIQCIIRLVFWYKNTCSIISKVVVTCVFLFWKSWVSLFDVRLSMGHS